MACSRSMVTARGGYHGPQRAMNCGFDASFSNLDRRNRCAPNVLRDVTVKEYPLVCHAPEEISIDRVTTLAGVDNALFLS